MGVAERHPVLLRAQDAGRPGGSGRWTDAGGWQRPASGPPSGRIHVRPAATRSLPQRRRKPQPAPAPVLPAAPYRLSGGALAAADGLDLYRRRLLEVLKERYVRGQISLAEFEASATLIARDPSARHLG
jgi:hypothetical protein